MIMKDITIKPALNGWKVQVGCQEILFTDRKKMVAEISRYINDPDDVEEEYISRAKNTINIGKHVAGRLTISSESLHLGS